MNFAVLASGHGGNLQAIINAVKGGAIHADLKVVVSDKPQAHALERARQAGISAVHIDPKEFSDREAFDQAMCTPLKEFKIDFVVLAGYMRLLSKHFIRQFPDKILNIHPALLPSFKGMHGIQDAWNYGVKVTGVTVHLVNEDMDAGPILAQEAVALGPRETLESLEEKIHAIEHRLYPKVIDLFAQGKLKISGRKVILK